MISFREKRFQYFFIYRSNSWLIFAIDYNEDTVSLADTTPRPAGQLKITLIQYDRVRVLLLAQPGLQPIFIYAGIFLASCIFCFFHSFL